MKGGDSSWTGSTGKDPYGLGGLDGLDDVGGDAGEWATPAPRPDAPLPPFRPSLSLERTRFAVALADGSTATVDVDHMSGQASLYRDGRHVRTADMPARFPLGRDRIEIAASRCGMQRIKLSVDRIAEQVGLGTGSNLRLHFRRLLDVSPSEYRATFAGQT